VRNKKPFVVRANDCTFPQWFKKKRQKEKKNWWLLEVRLTSWTKGVARHQTENFEASISELVLLTFHITLFTLQNKEHMLPKIQAKYNSSRKLTMYKNQFFFTHKPPVLCTFSVDTSTSWPWQVNNRCSLHCWSLYVAWGRFNCLSFWIWHLLWIRARSRQRLLVWSTLSHLKRKRWNLANDTTDAQLLLGCAGLAGSFVLRLEYKCQYWKPVQVN
jgi:hypothetical protein